MNTSFNLKKFSLTNLLGFAFFSLNLLAQDIPPDRVVDWTKAGLRGDIPVINEVFNVIDFGADPNGLIAVDSNVNEALKLAKGKLNRIYFPAGNYLFNNSLVITDSTILEGEGADKTKLTFKCKAEVDAISVLGHKTSVTYNLKSDGVFKTNYLVVQDPDLIKLNSMIYLNADDSALVFSSWAIGTVGQFLTIEGIKEDTLFLNNELRKDYLLKDNAKITLIKPVEWVGIECMSIERLDTTVINYSNIAFTYTRNCYVKNIESEYCNFSHIRGEWSTNLLVSGSYFRNSLDYGGGGRGYGVCLMFGTGDCLIENNIFNHLRHSMLVQAGSNGNVFAYNYSRDPFGTESGGLSGDIVCHGNYVFANLFESNICQNVIIDNSHGLNGPLNTFFRNRVETYGIYMSSTSNRQNFIGNEVTTAVPFAGFILQGTDHFIYGNNIKGVNTPAGTSDLSITTLSYSFKPKFLGNKSLPIIGYPMPYKSGTIPAYDRYFSGKLTSCEEVITNVVEHSIEDKNIYVYPNPASKFINIKFDALLELPIELELFDAIGKIQTKHYVNDYGQINIENLKPGIYFLKAVNSKGGYSIGKFIKINR